MEMSDSNSKPNLGIPIDDAISVVQSVVSMIENRLHGNNDYSHFPERFFYEVIEKGNSEIARLRELASKGQNRVNTDNKEIEAYKNQVDALLRDHEGAVNRANTYKKELKELKSKSAVEKKTDNPIFGIPSDEVEKVLQRIITLAAGRERYLPNNVLHIIADEALEAGDRLKELGSANKLREEAFIKDHEAAVNRANTYQKQISTFVDELEQKTRHINSMIDDIAVHKLLTEEGFPLFPSTYLNTVKQETEAALNKRSNLYPSITGDPSYLNHFMVLRYILAWSFLEYFDLDKHTKETLLAFLSTFRNSYDEEYKNALEIKRIIKHHDIFTAVGHREIMKKILKIWKFDHLIKEAN